MTHRNDWLPIGHSLIGNWDLFCLWQSIGYLNYSCGWRDISRLRHSHGDTAGLEDWWLGWRAIPSPLSLVHILTDGDIAANQIRTLGSCLTRKLVGTLKFVRCIVTMVDSYTTSERTAVWVNLVMGVRPPAPFAETYQVQSAELVWCLIHRVFKQNRTYWKGIRCRT